MNTMISCFHSVLLFLLYSLFLYLLHILYEIQSFLARQFPFHLPAQLDLAMKECIVLMRLNQTNLPQSVLNLVNISESLWVRFWVLPIQLKYPSEMMV